MSAVLDAQLLGSVFVTLFVIMDPPGTVPIFLALTSAMTGRQRVLAARQAVFVAFGVIVAFAVFGRALLSYLHISLPALQGAGGLLLLLVALELLTGKEEAPGSAEGVNVALVPLGTPLLAGPGAIVATMVFVQQAADKPENVRPKIAEGKLRKWMEEVVLLSQEHVNPDKHEGKTIEQLRAELSAKTGENVVIRRFARFQVGQ